MELKNGKSRSFPSRRQHPKSGSCFVCPLWEGEIPICINENPPYFPFFSWGYTLLLPRHVRANLPAKPCIYPRGKRGENALSDGGRDTGSPQLGVPIATTSPVELELNAVFEYLVRLARQVCQDGSRRYTGCAEGACIGLSSTYSSILLYLPHHVHGPQSRQCRNRSSLSYP